MTLLNASASRSIILAKRPRNSSDFRSTCFTSFSTASYFFFPIVRLQTIEQSADPKAPANAAALPPPGAGEAEASSSRNRDTVSLVSMKILRVHRLRIYPHFPYCIPLLWLSECWYRLASGLDHIFDNFLLGFRSEERRVGKECR